MSKNIAEGLGRMIGSKSAIDGAITAKGGVVTKGLENSATDIGTIPIPPPPVLIDKTITENGTYLPEDEYEVTILTNQTSPVELEDCNGDDIELSVKGNTVQNGTPTPQNPIQPSGTGERTENLIDVNASISGAIKGSPYSAQDYGTIISSQYTKTSDYIPITPNTQYTFRCNNQNPSATTSRGYAFYDDNKQVIVIGNNTLYDILDISTLTVTTPNTAAYIRISWDINATNIMFNVGSSPLPFELHGYKIGITNDSTTYNTYLGQVQTTRQIKKYEITGNEDWRKSSSIDGVFWINNFNNDYDNSLNNIISCMCTHYIAQKNSTGVSIINDKQICLYAYNATETGYHELYLRDTTYNTLESFIEYIKQQYAAGTPVTVWYVLENSTTGIVNEPLMKIGDYVDTLANVSIPTTEGDNTITVDTTVPPSSIDVSYNKSLGADGYSSVTANVPNTYTTEDEGKVVNNGALTSQTSTNINSNGTVNTTLNNEVVVNVPNTYTAGDEGKVVSSGALVPQTTMPSEITTNGTVDTTLFNSVTVNVPTGVDPEPINAVLEEANDELEAALGGGGSIPVAKGQVNFYDYDGTLIKSMSSAQFRGLENMPANPSHEGLTAQGWNWSLSDAKTYVATYGSLNIGQMYVTDDGKTRIYINLSEGRISPILKLNLNANTELDIDWGDGSSHSTWTTTSADYKDERHNYPDEGEYVIVITVVSGSFIFQSQSTAYSTFFTDGRNITSSSDRAYLNSIQKIEIGTGVTSIQSNAFYNCTSLSSITIPKGVTYISSNAFQYCYSLSSITIPDSVTGIGQYAFHYCYSLSSITIPEGITSIGSYTFQSCYSLSSITIPDGVTSISQYAFYNCTSLSSITIPKGVTYISSNAFQYCYSLSSITIPDGVTSISQYAFYNCTSLSSITIPNRVTSISQYAFYNCTSLSSITIPNRVTSIGTNVFQNCYSLSSITIPNGVSSIQGNAFQNCSSLSSITIPDSVTSIGLYTFNGCTSLSSITIPDSVTSIGSYAFNGCYSLSSITIPNGVTTIGSQTFYNCTSLSSITIPNGVTTIGSQTFSNCSCMDYIKFIPSTPPTVQNSNAWTSVSTSTIIYVPALVSNLYMNGTNYPAKASYTYLGYATYTSGEALPTTTTDETYTLTWYATSADAIAQTNPITQGTGDEVYSRATPVA